MLNSLRIQNFKSWKDTGDIQFGAITGFFGTNSSGKTSILQFLLMLKQTVESSDRSQVLNLGDERSYVELGTLFDVIHNHSNPDKLEFYISWHIPNIFFLKQQDERDEAMRPFNNDVNEFRATVRTDNNNISLEELIYTQDNQKISMIKVKNKPGFHVRSKGFINNRSSQFIDTLSPPFKFYGIPALFDDEFVDYYKYRELIYEFEMLFSRIYYLGPLREYPKRLYTWGGEKTDGVGNRGERAIAALLASRNQPIDVDLNNDENYSVEHHVAFWLKELGLIHSFAVRPIAPNRKEYEVRIKRTEESAEVFLTDVGFGVSQLLPVLVLLFYVPEGSTIILEQPEIHLHPAVQAGLADVFIDAIKRRNVQIILESHSEHLLQRLQRRLAEEALPTEQVKLYFTDFVGAASTLTPLDLDEYGNIRNWPKNFFGDTMGEASAMMEAELKRRTQQQS